MTQILRKGTAQTVSLGPFMSAAGAVQTGLTINAADIKVSKNGAAYVNKNSGGATHAVNGEYLATLDDQDTGTVGLLDISVLVAPAMVVKKTLQVLTSEVFDDLFGSAAAGYSKLGPADVANLDAPVSTRSSHSADDVWSVGARTVTGGTITTLSGHTPQTGDSYPRLGAPAGASISADIAAVRSGLPLRPTRGSGLPNFTFSMVNTAGDPLPGLTVSGLVRVDNGAFVALANSVSEVGAGFYSANITAGEMSGDEVTFLFTATGAVSRSFYMVTQPAVT